ncbi:MAG: sigma-E factor regulatory protein RseB domain-containing protein [Actinomycetes bacterium]
MRATAAAVVAAVGLLGAAPAVGDEAGREALQRAVDASRATAYEGRVVIVGFDATGAPTLAELDVARGRDGGMRVGVAERWTIGRAADVAFRSASAGELLALSGIEPLEFSVDDLLTKYDVARQGVSELVTGPATVVGVRERGAATDRERLHLDDSTGLVVRRETFDAAGEPVRLVAFTSLQVIDRSLGVPDGMTAPATTRTELSDRGLDALASVGWEVPTALDGGFRLREAYALPENDGGSVHLVYTDGLYTLSVYEQHGRLDPDAVSGARRHAAEGRHVWRWPGSEPERVVWSGAGMTFTAVSDAPLDTIVTAVSALPADPPPGPFARLTRGFERLGRMLWPFG